MKKVSTCNVAMLFFLLVTISADAQEYSIKGVQQAAPGEIVVLEPEGVDLTKERILWDCVAPWTFDGYRQLDDAVKVMTAKGGKLVFQDIPKQSCVMVVPNEKQLVFSLTIWPNDFNKSPRKIRHIIEIRGPPAENPDNGTPKEPDAPTAPDYTKSKFYKPVLNRISSLRKFDESVSDDFKQRWQSMSPQGRSAEVNRWRKYWKSDVSKSDAGQIAENYRLVAKLIDEGKVEATKDGMGNRLIDEHNADIGIRRKYWSKDSLASLMSKLASEEGTPTGKKWVFHLKAVAKAIEEGAK